MNQTNLSHETLDRIRVLRDSLIDLDVAIGDIDLELAPRLAERAELDTQLRAAESELIVLLRRAA